MVLLPSFIETSKWGEENVPQQIAVGQSMIEMEDVSTCLDHQIGYHLVPDSIYIYMHYIHLMLSNVIDSYRFAFMVGALYNLYMAACIVLIHSNDIPNSNQPPLKVLRKASQRRPWDRQNEYLISRSFRVDGGSTIA